MPVLYAAENGIRIRFAFSREASMRRRLVVLVVALLAIPCVAGAQVATNPTAACHVSDGAFTSCPNGQMDSLVFSNRTKC